jgi:streptogramin lyase
MSAGGLARLNQARGNDGMTGLGTVRRAGASALVLIGVFSVILTVGAGVANATGPVRNYTDPSINVPSGIASGSDGALWFTNTGNNSIGRITTSGVVSSYGDPTINGPSGITSGPDAALWFTNESSNSIGRITTSGAVSNFTDPSISDPVDIAAGSDGALWFVNKVNNSIGRVTTSGAVSNYSDPSISSPLSIAPGPDGALWFTNHGNNSIGRITTSGAVSNFTDPTISGPYGIAAGPDGALWFTNGGGSSIGRITTAGTVTNFTDSTIDAPGAITAGSDGALWYGNCLDSCSSIGRITTSGVVSNIADPTINSPGVVASGPDGNLWFPNFGNSSIGEIIVGAPYLEVNPSAGPSKTQIALSGGGFAAGETVKVTWNTGLSSPATDVLCSTVANGGGNFSCSASVPKAAGAVGSHKIGAKGSTSHTKVTATFTLQKTIVKAGSEWTITSSLGPCEVQTFSSGGNWTADLYGDQGTFVGGGTTISEDFTAGQHAGLTWSGQYSKPPGSYQGPSSFAGTITMSPGATAGC